MIISPAIQDYGYKLHRSWHITSIEEENYRSPVQATEKKDRFYFILLFSLTLLPNSPILKVTST